MSVPRTSIVAGCAVIAMGLSSCTGSSGGNGTSGAGSSENPSDSNSDGASQKSTATLRDGTDPVTVVGEDGSSAPDLAIGMSQALFASAPAVVVAQVGDTEGVKQGSDIAVELGIPMLLLDAPASADTATSTQGPDDSSQSTSPPPDDASSTTQRDSASASPQIEEIDRLGAQSVLAVGADVEAQLGDLSDVDLVTDTGDLSDVSPPEGLANLTVVLPGEGSDGAAPGSSAAGATAKAAGANIIPVTDSDLASDSDAITAIAKAKPDRLLAVGAEFGSLESLTRDFDVAKTGVQLPGGGQALFPGRRLIALYGTPGTPGLGVLGEQDVDASITRAQELAAEFEPFSDVPTVPAFEIIATVAHGAAGADGDYSGEISVETLRPWVEKAGEEGVYVVLDLQPGRATFLDQAKMYEDLLRMPHVGLALDPEWRLSPTQKPLGQIGRVEAAEVNAVIEWLADLTEEETLPQKLLVLHQFRLSMLQDQDQINMGRDEVQVLIHMDGQGTTGQKDSTWQSVVGAARTGTPFGWKNFFDEDVPMLTPEQTMTREPTPFMISYQ